MGSNGLGEVIVNAGASLAGLGVNDVISGGTAASVVVSGAGARWSSAGELYIGLQGTGSLTVNAQGTATAVGSAFNPAVSLGTAAGGQGSLLVSGTAAKLAANGAVYVGQSGVGHLRVENHGTAQTGGNALDPTEGVDISASGGGSGDVTVSGSTSLLTNTGGRTCELRGFPGVSYVAGDDGHQVGPAAAQSVRTRSWGWMAATFSRHGPARRSAAADATDPVAAGSALSALGMVVLHLVAR